MLWGLLFAAAALGVLLWPRRALAYVNGEAIDIELAEIGGLDSTGEPLRLEAATAADFRAMRDAASKEGVALKLNSGFRSMEKQTELFQGYSSGLPGFNLAAKPGYSIHQSGRAADFADCATPDTRTWKWLTSNAARWRFRNTGMTFTAQKEPWHWEHQA